MKARQQRLLLVLVGLMALAAVSWLIFNALGSSMSYFFSPTEVAEQKAPGDHVFRLGGMVVKGSVERGEALKVRFRVTDFANEVMVEHEGILPDLFMEGQGVVAQGKLNAEGVFVADEVLAKHDETYVAPEVADALEKGRQAEQVIP